MKPSDPTAEAVRPLSPEVERALLGGRQRFLAFLERRLGNRAAAEDLLQSALLRAVERGSPADGEGAVPWFYRVLRNALVDRERGTSAERKAKQAAAEPQGHADLALRDAVCACFRDLLPALKPEYAQLLERVDLSEQPVPRVAAELGITPNNAGVRLHRARQALKKQLQRACGACATHGCLDCHCRTR